ncbi:hypothetical protein DCS_01799 [Drechmeria coniospora]|uniref:Uncharacterized protein n=1 Tax=Drechmeria coniospora TaxID=98403 RepID=A0A151GUB4_DRECN|nr:hypothetical protein DCS_01799 [Drechmeria coniospora]KYK60661.1 hypothetical protein DCS_01799 [Drechmeria coniospora]
MFDSIRRPVNPWQIRFWCTGPAGHSLSSRVHETSAGPRLPSLSHPCMVGLPLLDHPAGSGAVATASHVPRHLWPSPTAISYDHLLRPWIRVLATAIAVPALRPPRELWHHGHGFLHMCSPSLAEQRMCVACVGKANSQQPVNQRPLLPSAAAARQHSDSTPAAFLLRGAPLVRAHVAESSAASRRSPPLDGCRDRIETEPTERTHATTRAYQAK